MHGGMESDVGVVKEGGGHRYPRIGIHLEPLI